MRQGCMERLNRKRGPEVRQFRWSEIDPGGKRLYGSEQEFVKPQ
jgi:hypothetical protein